MRSSKHAGISIGVVLCLAAMGLLFSWNSLESNAQSSCVGKPYPSPTCPILRAQQTSSEAALCGNGRIDGNEECDEGIANGTTTGECSNKCKVRYCGDGALQSGLGEQCEPTASEFYAASGTGLIIERRFTAAECGANYCTPPTCDEDGDCFGGCKSQDLPACVASTSSSSNKSSSSSSNVALVSSSSSATSSSTTPVASSSIAAASSAASTGPSSTSSSSSVSSATSESSSLSNSSVTTSNSSTSSVAVSSQATSSAALEGPTTSGIGLSIAMDGPLIFQQGQQAVYRISVRNNSAMKATNVVVNDYLINYGSVDNFTLDVAIGSTGRCSLTGISVRCSEFDLNPGEIKTMRMTFLFQPKPSCAAQQKIDSYASVTSDLVDQELRDNETDLYSSIVKCAAASAISSSSSRPIVIRSSSSRLSSSSVQRSSSVASSSEESSSSSEEVVASVCGNSKEEPGETCDYGEQNGVEGSICDASCQRILPGPEERVDSFESTRVLMLRVSYGLLGMMIPGYLFVSRKKWLRLFKEMPDDDIPMKAKSIDDVPLDEIEMPWRKL